MSAPPWAVGHRVVLLCSSRLVAGWKFAAHLAITLCRCLNIPARYCTVYLGYTGIPLGEAPVDFSAWFEVFLENSWHIFDARHNIPRCGRVLIARGRDAADVPFLRSFGEHELVGFAVTTELAAAAPLLA